MVWDWHCFLFLVIFWRKAIVTIPFWFFSYSIPKFWKPYRLGSYDEEIPNRILSEINNELLDFVKTVASQHSLKLKFLMPSQKMRCLKKQSYWKNLMRSTCASVLKIAVLLGIEAKWYLSTTFVDQGWYPSLVLVPFCFRKAALQLCTVHWTKTGIMP